MAGCERCAATIDEAIRTVGDLAYAVPDEDPPAHLRVRIMAAVAREPRRGGAAAPPGGPQPPPVRDTLLGEPAGRAGGGGTSGAAPAGGGTPGAVPVEGHSAEGGTPEVPAGGDAGGGGGTSGAVPAGGGGTAGAVPGGGGGTAGAAPGGGGGTAGAAPGGGDAAGAAPGGGDAAGGSVGGVPAGGGTLGGGTSGGLPAGGEASGGLPAGGVPAGPANGATAGGAWQLPPGGWPAGRAPQPPAAGPAPGTPLAGLAGSTVGPGAPPLDRGRRLRLILAAAAAVALIVGLAGWNAVLRHDQQQLRNQVAARQSIIDQLTRQGPARVAALDAAPTGRLVATVVVRTGGLDVITESLPPNDAATSTYWLWALRGPTDAHPVPLAGFDVGSPGLSVRSLTPTRSGLLAVPIFAVSREPGRATPVKPTVVVASSGTGPRPRPPARKCSLPTARARSRPGR